MRAFSQICSKINITLNFNTLTVYHKDQQSRMIPREKVMFYHKRATESYLFFQDMNYHKKKDLGIKGCLYHNEPEHGLHHPLGVGKDMWHVHVQFIDAIDEQKFVKLTDLFVQRQILTAEEQRSIMNAYREATFVDVYEYNFNKQLCILIYKADELHQYAAEQGDCDCKFIAELARRLHRTLSLEMQIYCKNKTQNTYQVFYYRCHKAIAEVREKFEKISECTNIIKNIGLAIALLGIGYVAVGLVNLACTGRFLFFKSESNAKCYLDNTVNEVISNLNQIPRPLGQRQ